jgi:hypothetical protein
VSQCREVDGKHRPQAALPSDPVQQIVLASHDIFWLLCTGIVKRELIRACLYQGETPRSCKGINSTERQNDEEILLSSKEFGFMHKPSN